MCQPPTFEMSCRADGCDDSITAPQFGFSLIWDTPWRQVDHEWAVVGISTGPSWDPGSYVPRDAPVDDIFYSVLCRACLSRGVASGPATKFVVLSGVF